MRVDARLLFRERIDVDAEAARDDGGLLGPPLVGVALGRRAVGGEQGRVIEGEVGLDDGDGCADLLAHAGRGDGNEEAVRVGFNFDRALGGLDLADELAFFNGCPSSTIQRTRMALSSLALTPGIRSTWTIYSSSS